LNEGKLELNARVKIRAKDFNDAGGGLQNYSNYRWSCYFFNEVVPEAAGYVNDV
jgi:DNA-directed RNA polymerase subunit beta'